MKRTAAILIFLATVFVSAGHAEEIGYIEDFALAKDRTVPLKQLIPGTEDYYYYHSLHYQNTEQFDKVDELLKLWIKRHNYTSRVREILNRQALLTYSKDPQKSLEYIRQQLGINFNHQREVRGENPNLPNQLDPKAISRAALQARALSRYKNLQGFEDAALDWLVASKLSADQRRHLLQRLQRPDYPNLPKLVVDDLNYKYSSGFGSFGIHRQLLLTQLEECLKLKPDLLNQTHFVNTYLTKLRPNPDDDWQNDPKERVAYLDRLWGFVSKLAPAHNSLKANVLYHRLVFDRSQGTYDKERFMAYIALPRSVSYIDSDYMKLENSRRWPANLNADFRSVTMLPPVGNDEPLVRSYLHHFFIKETATKPYETYINDIYLKHNLAETKIVNGLGEPEQWYSMLPPAKYQALKERIDLDFAFTNKRHFAVDVPVTLDLYVKNVKSLIVKVYEINTANFYQQNLREIDTSINLDGLVANHETTFNYPEPPLRRVHRHFEFDQLKERGVYVIDFIGNGKSSRALVRKGKLRHLVRTGTAGQTFTILDENNQQIKDATVWQSGRKFEPNDEGEVTVPFSNQPGRRPVVIQQGDFASLDHFDHQSENYSLQAAIYVDREALLKRKKATAIVRSALRLNGTPVTLSVLENVKLAVTSTDLDGVSTTKEVADFKLFEDRESEFEFQVPQRLTQISFTLTAKVEVLSQNKKADLSASQTFSLNEIDRSEKVADLHFANMGGTYIVEVLGRTGEPRVNQGVRFTIKHRDFRDPVNVSLQTDRSGRIVLGALDGISWVNAQGPNGVSHRWHLLDDRHSQYASVNGSAGGAVRIPYMGSGDEPSRDQFSLLESRSGTFVSDRFESLSLKNGFLVLGGLERGDYDLLLKRSGNRISVRLTEGKRNDDYVLGENRHLQVRGEDPLQISDVAAGDKEISIQLRNASEFTRLHVFATRYQPAYSVYGEMARIQDPEPYVVSVGKTPSQYIAGRNIGDEFRYIIERKLAKRFPGNMLQRPSLLLNPWAIRKTETAQQLAEQGESFGGEGGGVGGMAKRDPKRAPSQGGLSDFSNLDFLASASAVMLNLAPNEDGVVTIERDVLGPHQHLHFVAVDPATTVYRTLALAESAATKRDLRLVEGLDPKEHFSQQKQITVVQPKKEFVIEDISTSRFEAYDSLPRVYALYATLSGDAKLADFPIILNWHKPNTQEKRSKYSKYACHELNYFVYRKDRDFFNEVVQPYLKNKKDKTFLDLWLTGEDVKEYLKPWKHGQLNVVERILLAQRIKGEQEHTARHVKDLFNLLPPNIDRFNYLFSTAIKGSALDTSDAFGYDEAKDDDLVLETPATEDAPDANILQAFNAPAAPPSDSGERAKEANERRSAETKSEEKLARRIDELQRNQLRKASKRNAGADYYARDKDLRTGIRQFYQKLDKTKEWVENNYYHLPIPQQNAELVTVNAFWRDYAEHGADKPFYSTHFAEASRNFTEMMFALSVLDLPAEAGEHETKYDESKMALSADSTLIALHEEIRKAETEIKNTPILVSQNFFQHGDRYRYVNNERLDKYVDDEFLVHTVYGCQVVVTNPTSSPQKLDVLLQIPVGALPVMGGKYTKSAHVNLQPYHTQTVEYYFYFPLAGDFAHYPVQVAKNEKLVAFAEPRTFQVVNEPTKIDRTSWDYISQHGSREDVMAYLQDNNLDRTNLDRIAFRMSDERVFKSVIELLAKRHVYNNTLWSYSIKHNDVPAVREYLQHADSFVSRCGTYIDSPLLTIDPVVRKIYEHMDYRPLVNARAHQLGRRRQILNDRFHAQYHRLLRILGYRRDLDDDELMAVTYYLLLQDRVAEALGFFGRVDAKNLATGLQYDYFDAYISMYLGDVGEAREIADRYADHPVDRWRNAFAAVASQLDEITGADVQVVDEEQRGEVQTKLAASEPSFEFDVESKRIAVDYQNLESVDVRYYLMDIELLFSTNPFVQPDANGRIAKGQEVAHVCPA